MIDNIKISIIIITYNSSDFIKRCLESIYNQSFKDFEIVVIDNNSQDDTVLKILDNFKDIKLIKSKKNLGFASGINLGIKYCQGNFIAVLNPDIILDKRWLLSLMEAAQNYPKAYIFSSKILNYNQRNLIENAGYEYTVFGTHHLIGYHEIDRGQYDQIRKVFYGTGCALFFRRSVINTIGLFDEKYFLYAEEVDFCWRCLLAGYDILFIPNAKVFHYRRASTSKLVDTYIFYLSRRNVIRTILKNQDFLVLFYALPMRILIDFIMSLKTSLQCKNYKYFSSFLKSLGWNCKNLDDILRFRAEYKKIEKRSNQSLIKMGLMHYFFPKFFKNIRLYF